MSVPDSDRVIIVGAGPTGLVLAAELALAGIRCLVLERRGGPRTDSRAICLHARSMETLNLRGQASLFAEAGLAVPSFPLGPRGVVARPHPARLSGPGTWSAATVCTASFGRALVCRSRDLPTPARCLSPICGCTGLR